MIPIAPWLPADALDRFPGLSAHERLEIHRHGGAHLPLAFPGDGTLLRHAAAPVPAGRPTAFPDLSDDAATAPWHSDPQADPDDAWLWIRSTLCRRLGLARRWRLLQGRPAAFLPDPPPVLMLAAPEDLASLVEDPADPAAALWAAAPLTAENAWIFCEPPVDVAADAVPDGLLDRPHDAILVPTVATARRLRAALQRPRAVRLIALDRLLVGLAAEEDQAWATLGALGRESALRLGREIQGPVLPEEAITWMAHILSYIFGLEEQRLLFT